MKKALVIDGNNLIFKAYYATAYQGNNLHSSQGTPTNAVYAFIRMLNKYLLENNYDAIFVAFDAGKNTFRTKILDSYKSNRSSTPSELLIQLQLVKEFLSLAQINWLQKENFEADDLIGTITKSPEAKEYNIDIISSDKDLYQLLDNNVKIIIPEKGLSTIKIFNEQSLQEKYEIKPNQIPDLKGLMGDNSDNLPGIKGIGPKTAIKLLKEYQNLENIIANLENLKEKEKSKIIEHQEMGLLTKKLATIDTKVAIETNLIHCTYDNKFLNNKELQNFYKKYNMRSLIKNEQKPNTLINNKNSEIQILNSWKKEYNSGTNFIWVEVCWDNYHIDEINGIAIKNENGTFFLNNKTIKNDDEFHAFLNTKEYNKITWDIKKTYIAIHNNFNIKTKGFIFDHMLASYLLYANENIHYENIANILELNDENISNDIFYGKGAKRQLITEEKKLSKFLESKLLFLTSSYDLLISKLKNNDNWDLYNNIELPTAFALINTEENGVLVDQEQLEIITNRVFKKLQILEEEINTISGYKINPNSPKQISNLLFEELKLRNLKKNSTAFEVLTNLKNEHPIINILIEHRKLSKLYNTYLIGLKKYIFKDNKIHTIYNQVQTSTGRLSSIEPNMQNISVKDQEQKEVRKIFVASDNKTKVVSFDYSQIELRILAHISNDENLISAFKNNHDIHQETASKIFNTSLQEVTKEQRNKAKAVNFGIVYGISEFGLAQQLNISVKESKEFIDKYFLIYHDIKNYINKVISSCQEKGYVETIFKRRREVVEINNKNRKIQEFGQRIAMNMPIQGSCADIIKLAMIEINQKIENKEIKAKMIAQVHDELIFEINEADLISESKKISKIMSEIIDLKVPLIVNHSSGTNWYELK